MIDTTDPFPTPEFQAGDILRCKDPYCTLVPDALEEGRQYYCTAYLTRYNSGMVKLMDTGDLVFNSDRFELVESTNHPQNENI